MQASALSTPRGDTRSMPRTDPRESRADRTETANDATDPDGNPSSAPDLNSVFTALSHPRRIYLIHALVNGTGGTMLPDLSTEIASQELDKPIEEVTVGERKRIHLSLYHSHLPKLADLDVIEYDDREDVVRPKDVSQVKAVLDGTDAQLDA